MSDWAFEAGQQCFKEAQELLETGAGSLEIARFISRWAEKMALDTDEISKARFQVDPPQGYLVGMMSLSVIHNFMAAVIKKNPELAPYWGAALRYCAGQVGP